MAGQVVVVVAIGLFAALWVSASAWSSAAKRRDAARTARFRRPGSRR